MRLMLPDERGKRGVKVRGGREGGGGGEGVRRDEREDGGGI